MRLDLYMVETFNKTRSQAQDLIKQGKVSVDGVIITKSSMDITGEQVVIEENMPYVSRGGLKLEDAIKSFKLDLTGLVMADIGASTGGFTDCALKHGVTRVYAYDVGTDQLHMSLKDNPNIISFEQTNILDVIIPSEVNLITIDVSFTSVKPILTHLKQKALYIVLVKPQFEVGIKHIHKGIVRSALKQNAALDGIIEYATALGYRMLNVKKTDLLGKMGNQEFLLLLSRG
ncbi:MAG: TlyA family rRNA (cytidine-2'-O)-methyltransferase [Tenericutes bacterium HGW-Tenericutes-8]|nr:MAG: TlyA family rRNA (cytidine-2'-O)-methyltransferase [Tenericutes bacterium HGW-Tenericutes-8]